MKMESNTKESKLIVFGIIIFVLGFLIGYFLGIYNSVTYCAKVAISIAKQMGLEQTIIDRISEHLGGL